MCPCEPAHKRHLNQLSCSYSVPNIHTQTIVHTTQSVAIGYIYAVHAMWPNNQLIIKKGEITIISLTIRNVPKLMSETNLSVLVC